MSDLASRLSQATELNAHADQSQRTASEFRRARWGHANQCTESGDLLLCADHIPRRVSELRGGALIDARPAPNWESWQ